jgi:hypothetical protein
MFQGRRISGHGRLKRARRRIRPTPLIAGVLLSLLLSGGLMAPPATAATAPPTPTPTASNSASAAPAPTVAPTPTKAPTATPARRWPSSRRWASVWERPCRPWPAGQSGRR